MPSRRSASAANRPLLAGADDLRGWTGEVRGALRTVPAAVEYELHCRRRRAIPGAEAYIAAQRLCSCVLPCFDGCSPLSVPATAPGRVIDYCLRSTRTWMTGTVESSRHSARYPAATADAHHGPRPDLDDLLAEP
ncbi:hypothetical protein [Streptomyces aidingensis]|uniref:hypothetical protein n=1 Tax=Streptomyces aidingensis TaxID=910347 RepID=UPI00158754E8|nr:hypothetical protein [Streptomyces aidingensis]